MRKPGILHKKSRVVPPHVAGTLPALDEAGANDKMNFFLTASHQLKSPVAIIQWCLQSIIEEKDAPKELLYLARKALDQADDMSHLLADMLQVFRMMTGKQAVPVVPLKLNVLIGSILDQYDLVAHNKGVHIVRGVIENLPEMMGKETLIRQALMNLVDNAVKYTPSGKHVTVSAKTEHSHIVVSVADEGIGIPSAEQPRLFSEFFRGEEAREVAHEGTGLGLVLVKRIVEDAGGEIHFSSQIHHGTTFVVRLPYRS